MDEKLAIERKKNLLKRILLRMALNEIQEKKDKGENSMILSSLIQYEVEEELMKLGYSVEHRFKSYSETMVSW